MTKRSFDNLKRREQARDALRGLRDHARLAREVHLRSLPQLPTDEIIRRLQAIKASDHIDRHAHRIIGMSTIAKRAQLSLQHLYFIANGQRVPNERTAQKLSAALQGVDITHLD